MQGGDGGGAKEIFNWGPGLGGDTERSRARRGKQDEYRKALDAQIEERRIREKCQRESRQPSVHSVPEKAVQDPVAHLMHWVKETTSKAAPEQQQQQPSSTQYQHQPSSTQYQQQPPSTQYQQQPPSTQYQHQPLSTQQQPPSIQHQLQSQSQQGSYPYGQPEAASFYTSQPPPPPPPPGSLPQAPPAPLPTDQHQGYPAQAYYQNQFHPHHNVAYGYYPSQPPSAIPPPPTYVPSPYLPYGTPPQMSQQQQQHMQGFQAIPPPPPFEHKSQDAPENPTAIEQDNAKVLVAADAPKKHYPHVSQCYEDIIASKGTDKDRMDDYRIVLEKQLEQKRKIDEERLANEKKMDEMLKRRDDMILQREREGQELERRNKLEKEAERLRKAEEAAKAIEEQMKEAKRMKEAKFEEKRKEVEAAVHQHLNGDDSKETSMVQRENFYDSVPIPLLVKRVKEPEGKQIDMGGSGDNNMSIIGTFQSSNNSNHVSTTGYHHKKKYVEESGRVGSTRIEEIPKKEEERTNYNVDPIPVPKPCVSREILVAPEIAESRMEPPSQLPPKGRIRPGGAETYRKRNSHTPITAISEPVKETYLYVPVSSANKRNADEPKVSTQERVNSALHTDDSARTCPNCRHALSGNLLIDTKDQSTETEESQSSFDKKQKEVVQDQEFLLQLQTILKDESAQVKHEMELTDKELREYEFPKFLIPTPISKTTNT